MSDPNPGGYITESANLLRDHPNMGRSVAESSRSFDLRRTEAYRRVGAGAWRDWAREVKDHTLTNLNRYLQEAEGIRPDLTVIVTSYLNIDWYAFQLRGLTTPCAEGAAPLADRQDVFHKPLR